MRERFKDDFIVTVNSQEMFDSEVLQHESSIERRMVKPGELAIFGIIEMTEGIDGRYSAQLARLEQTSVDMVSIAVNDEALPIWKDTFECGSKMAIVLNWDTFVPTAIPVSDNVKLSVSNRSTLGFNGKISEQKCSNIALAKTFEDMIRQRSRNSLQLICIEGKVQSILTGRYKATNQVEVFNTCMSEFSKESGEIEFTGGSISHVMSSGVWTMQRNTEIQPSVEVRDSSTGDGGIGIAPRLTAKGRNVLFDDAWTSRHCSITLSEIRNGSKAALSKAMDNVSLLMATQSIPISHPVAYMKNVISELNKLAKKMGSILISKKGTEYLIDQLNTMLMFNSSPVVWDFIDILWAYPEDDQISDEHRSSLEKTVSRILTIDHTKMDAIKEEKLN